MRYDRRGFTVMETTLAIGILAVGLVLVAELVTWSLAERARLLRRQEAIEAAANIMEAARACPWEQLDADWAARQRLPESLAARLREGRVAVRVEREKHAPALKRLTVVIEGKNMPPVQLTGLYSARVAKTGGKP